MRKFCQAISAILGGLGLACLLVVLYLVYVTKVEDTNLDGASLVNATIGLLFLGSIAFSLLGLLDEKK